MVTREKEGSEGCEDRCDCDTLQRVQFSSAFLCCLCWTSSRYPILNVCHSATSRWNVRKDWVEPLTSSLRSASRTHDPPRAATAPSSLCSVVASGVAVGGCRSRTRSAVGTGMEWSVGRTEGTHGE